MLFPLGTFTKAQVREFAEKHGLQNAHKRESQDICFVSGGKYTDFLRRYTGHDYKQGDFVDLQGHKLGTHKGIVNYTIGQRKGLGIAYTEPLFVCSKNPKSNTVVLGTEGDGLSSQTIADCDYTVKIPMSHGVDSLNVAAASAVAFWELGYINRRK